MNIETTIWYQGHITASCGATNATECQAMQPSWEIAPDCLCARESGQWPCTATVGTPHIKLDNTKLADLEDLGL